MTFTYFFEAVKKQWKQELPFVLYNNPNSNTIVGQFQNTDILNSGNDFSKSGFVFAPFDSDPSKTIWFYDDESRFFKTNKTTATSLKNEIVNNTAFDEKEKKKHFSIINSALKELKEKRLSKVIVSRVENNEITQFSIQKCFERMIHFYPNTFCYCWYHPKVGLWVGATPETLISLNENKFETMALAGTMPYELTTDVVWENKEKEEQQFVVDSIVEGLKQVISDVEIGDTTTQKAGGLLHLKTPIKGKVTTKKQLKVLVELLHPTSAVCGIPKIGSEKFILQNENYNREYYTGFLGVVKSTSNSQLYVNLRCMKIENKNAKIYIGGGITALSNAEQEWQETVNKSQIMKAVL